MLFEHETHFLSVIPPPTYASCVIIHQTGAKTTSATHALGDRWDSNPRKHVHSVPPDDLSGTVTVSEAGLEPASSSFQGRPSAADLLTVIHV